MIHNISNKFTRGGQYKVKVMQPVREIGSVIAITLGRDVLSLPSATTICSFWKEMYYVLCVQHDPMGWLTRVFVPAVEYKHSGGMR